MGPEKEALVSDKKGLGETVLGWFVVREGEDEETAETPEDAVQAYGKKPPPPRPPVHAPPSIRLQGDVPQVAVGVAPDQRVFAQVYKAAQITDDAQERVQKTLSLLGSLTGDTPKDVRKQIVEASLNSYWNPLEQIIETAAEENQAL